MDGTNLQQMADLLYGLGLIPHQVQGTGAEKTIKALEDEIERQEKNIAWLQRIIEGMVADKVTSSEAKARIISV
jgi:hypothetical protein